MLDKIRAVGRTYNQYAPSLKFRPHVYVILLYGLSNLFYDIKENIVVSFLVMFCIVAAGVFIDWSFLHLRKSYASIPIEDKRQIGLGYLLVFAGIILCLSLMLGALFCFSH
jgi:hypothetical protein